MADAKVLGLSVESFTADKLKIKVKNSSGSALTSALAIEFYAPTFLVDKKIKDAAEAAATSLKPIGAASLAGTVTGPESLSVWAKRETSDTSVTIALFNDTDQSGDELATPIEIAAGAEFIISIPLKPQIDRAALITLVYSYQYGDGRIDDNLELKSDKIPEWTPDVRLTTNHASPTAIKEGSLVKIFWHVKDGVSGTLRGPLPGGNDELPLKDDFKVSAGSIEVRVVSSMTYILQVQVKVPNSKDNVEVVRMLSLDTRNKNFTYLSPRPRRVLPYGLIEIDWAAWGVKQVLISVGVHTNRTIDLTQQTLGRFYEGSGVMRVTAPKVIGTENVIEQITLEAPGEKPQSETVTMIPWMPMTTRGIEGDSMGLAVVAPKIGLLTTSGLHIGHVAQVDPTPFSEKLEFSLKPAPAMMWLALAAVDQRFVCLRSVFANNLPDLEIVPFMSDGSADEIPAVTLPEEVRLLAFNFHAVFDFVGFRGRAYFVVETPLSAGAVRRAWSVGFDSKKADLRPEPRLEPLIGYRLVSFDKGLYALNRNTGRMFRFDLTTEGELEPPKIAASAVKKAGAREESMVKDGLLTPVGRLLVVLNPTSVPSLAALARVGLQNTLRHSSTSSTADENDRDDIPQDLVYNPQKDRWARCGHNLDAKPLAKAAFRGGQSMRLWVVQPDNKLATLAVGGETLFAPTYVFEFPSKPLPPYLNKTRQFKITNNTDLQLLPLNETLRNAGLNDFGGNGPAQLTSRLPNEFRNGATETFEFKYNDADPSPINLRFLVPPKGGVKNYYLLEVTFSGPDLSTAKSAFRRVVVNERGIVLSIAEIPGTAVQHATNTPLVIPRASRLIDGVKFSAQNLTTYQLWREAPQAKDRLEILNRYFGDEIKIAYDTPTFFLSAYGAGQLHVNVDFALPVGIEISPSTQPQLKLIRIATEKSTGLHPELLPNKAETSFACKISYQLKQELQAVYIGDGVATEKGDAIYLPVAHHDFPVIVHVWKINPENLSTSATTTAQIQSTGVFSSPNSIVLCKEFIFAMFGDTDIHVMDQSLQVKAKVSVANAYTVVTGIKSPNELCFLLGFKKNKGTTQNISFNHFLGTELLDSRGQFKRTQIREVQLDTVKGFREQNRMTGFPTWVSPKTVSPMAVSPSERSTQGEFVREVAVCIDGGLFVIASTDQLTRVLALESAGREEDVVFGREGKSIYCLHSQGDDQRLRVSRVDNQAWKQTHGLSLPRGEGVADLTTDTRPRQRETPYKNQRSASMVISRDDKWLFVSHGRSIFKIDVAKMELRETYKTELPCRVFHVWWGKPTEGTHAVYGTPSSCTLLYAIGASYKGDGIKDQPFKTHLYKLAIPD